jgi:Uma2 family endonuclease
MNCHDGARTHTAMYNSAMAVEVIPKLTYEEFRQLPDDGKRYELIQGRVHLSPAPSTRHQFVAVNLDRSLGPFVANNHLGELLLAPLDVCLSEDTALQPDLVFVSSQRLEIIQENFIAGAPDLVVEILSPSTAAHDRATKLNLYAEAGVPEVWLMDPLAGTVEVLKLRGNKYLVDSILSGRQTLTSSLFPGWEITLDELFRFPSRSL